ncbi:hypothetical protein [Streptomyces sp. WAC08241]|uniref:hypothetical protein n=1 Tax=Streptomyces sp. WAC08241 TaxID=2487421 RepID=UPI00163B6241|nr:hypothetical protein [Streptomyces sp. WAC08241]
MYSETHSPTSSGPYPETRSRPYSGHDVPGPQTPAWLLAGEDDENDGDHPHICRGID